MKELTKHWASSVTNNHESIMKRKITSNCIHIAGKEWSMQKEWKRSSQIILCYIEPQIHGFCESFMTSMYSKQTKLIPVSYNNQCVCSHLKEKNTQNGIQRGLYNSWI